MKKIPSIVIAGIGSGVGKTTLSIALMAALRRRGLRVQPFKVGPDFIDPTLHARAAGRTGRNLDGWMLSPKANRTVFKTNAADADVAVIEGVMGLFDGRDAVTEAGSTAEMAKLLSVPVALTVDARAMARSAAAVVSGFERFDPDLRFSGVVFNRVSGEGHYEYLRDAVSKYCQTPPLGWLEPDETVAIRERHLGLLMGDEVLTEERLDALARWLERHVEIDRLLGAAPDATPVASEGNPHPPPVTRPAGPRVRIGVARDAAFRFYYQDNLDLLAGLGAEIVEFSPIADTALPEGIQGLYFGGGYPEIHAEQLGANRSLKSEILNFVESGGPVYAECGGFMYLTKAIVDADGREFPMVGAFETRALMQTRLAALGYAEVTVSSGAAWIRDEVTVRGHEFHYSNTEHPPTTVRRGYAVAQKGRMREEGFWVHRTLASYIHLHFLSCPRFAEQFLAACSDFRIGKKSQIETPRLETTCGSTP
jgi:cobyrinic acid a,c-diamide synthase